MSADNGFWLIGNLTRDAELKYLASGAAVANFSIAHNRKYKNSSGQMVEEASYFDCQLWGKIAESLNQYLTKGKLVAISGEMKQDRWEQDGQARSKVKLNVDQIRLLPSGNRDGGQGGGHQSDGYDGDSHDWANNRQGGGQRQGGGAPRGGGQGGQGGQRPPANRPPQGDNRPGPAADDFTDDIPFN